MSLATSLAVSAQKVLRWLRGMRLQLRSSIPAVRPLILVFALTVLHADASSDPQHRAPAQSVIQLATLGYPQPPCDYMFQDKDAYPKRHIEFLDSQHLMVSFPLRSHCDAKNPYPPLDQKFRTVVLTLSGNPLHSFEWSLGQNIQAGPDGHILLSAGREIRILDSDFTPMQTIVWVPEDDPQWKLIQHWRGAISLAPSRHGFLVQDTYPQYRVGYFEGNPAKEILAADSCPGLRAVADGGFACGQVQTESARLSILVGKDQWHVDDPLLQDAGLPALPTPKTLLVVTNKFQLYEFVGSTAHEKIADLRWLAPGWNSGFRYEMASGAAGRILYFSHGARFGISDSYGFGRYLRVAVLDVNLKKIIFRKQYPIDSDVSISPDGHQLAVREKDRVTLNALP